MYSPDQVEPVAVPERVAVMERGNFRRLIRSRERGINLIEVVIASIVLTVAGIAVIAAMDQGIHASVDPEPKVVAQSAVQNVQTDLQAMAMYTASPLASLHSGQTITITPSSAPAGATYLPSDTKAVTITLKTVNPTTTQSVTTGAQVQLQYSVPGPSSSPALTGSSTVTLTQRAATCDPNLAAKLASSPAPGSSPCP